MERAHPLISVIIPAHDREAFIGDALESVFAQGYDPFEVVVVDDGSSDGTARVVESFGRGVRCICQGHSGVSAARNRGLAEARGEWIAFLDSDDVWTEGSLRVRADVLAQRADVEIVYGKVRVRQLVAGAKMRRYGDGEVVYHPAFGSMLIRRSVFDRVGRIDESFAHSEDVDWLCRAKDRGIVPVPVEAIVMEYRLHDDNMTSRTKDDRAPLFAALKHSLDRKRGEGKR
jgi:glycosyltransferase involved in cell wall biosynthesis